MKNLFISFIGYFCVSVFLGCGLPDEYHKAMRGVPKKVLEIDSFLKKFPDNTQSIARFFDKDKSVYTCKTMIHGRYLVRIDVENMKFDNGYSTLKSYGLISCTINEVTEVSSEDGGRVAVLYGYQKSLELKELEFLAKNGWDFKKIGVVLVKDKPVVGIEKYWNTLVSRNRG